VGPNGALGIFGGPTQEWIEMNPTGEIVGRFPLPQLARPGVSEFLGVAITADGEVYAGANQHVENENAPLLFKLARSKKQWEVLPSEAFALWLGTEGSQLVLAGQ
jgi:hypothetical protein